MRRHGLSSYSRECTSHRWRSRRASSPVGGLRGTSCATSALNSSASRASAELPALPAHTRLSHSRWSAKTGWVLVAILSVLLVLSISFNLYCLAIRGCLTTLRSKPAHLIEDSLAMLPPSLSVDLQQQSRPRSLSGTASAQASASSSHSRHLSGNSGHPHDALLFLFNALIVGVAVVHVTSLPVFHGVQQTVVIFLLGLIYSLVQEGLGVKEDIGVFGESYDMWMGIDPHLLLFTLLPPLLAGDAMAIDTNVAKRVANQCLYLASVGVMVNGMLTALFLMVYLDWSFLLSLMTGAILCATDPVAVVALLKELGASPTLTVQIQGESLLNDGTAIVLYTVTYNMIKGEKYDASDIIMFLIKTAVMAWFLGMIIGYLFFVWIKAASSKLNHSSTIIQISLTLCCAYWSFIMAEGVFHISGVLGTVAASLTLASKMWPHIVSEHAMHDVWHTFESLGNIIIFFLAGALTGNTMVHIDLVDYFHLVVIYIVLVVVRTSLIFLSRPLLAILGADKQPIPMGDAAVIAWGGLRGAVGLALAVQVNQDRAAKDGVPNIDKHDAQRILFFVAGVAFLTLIINATTCPALVKWLGIAAPPSAKKDLQRMLHQQMLRFVETKQINMDVMQSVATVLIDMDARIEDGQGKPESKSSANNLHQDLEDTAHSTALVEEIHSVREEYAKVDKAGLEAIGIVPSSSLVEQEPLLEELVSNSPIDWGREDAVNVAFLALVNSAYWHMLEARDVTPGSKEAEVLLTSVAFARSQLHGELVDFNFVFPHVQKEPAEEVYVPEQFVPVKRGRRVGASMLRNTRIAFQRMQFQFFSIVESTSFNVFFALAVIVNGIYIAVEDISRNDQNDDHIVWLVIEFAFVVSFTVEFLLKVLAFGKVYFLDGWNIFDLILVASGIFGLVLGMISRAEDVKGNSDVSNEGRVLRVSKILKVMRLLRLFRLVRFWKKIQAKIAKQEISFEVADYMKKTTILTCFVKAHLSAQKEFYRYFCGTPTKAEPIKNVEVARCMLQSQVFIYRASILAHAQLEGLDSRFVHEVNCMRESKVVTEELEDFVIRAFERGVITAREAEAILIPLHHHIKECMKNIQNSSGGITPSNKKTKSKTSLDIMSPDGTVNDQMVDGAPAASSTDPFLPVVPAAGSASSTEPYFAAVSSHSSECTPEQSD